MTRELSSEGWAVDKLRMVSQIKPKYRKWTPGVIGTIDKDKCIRNVIDLYDYEPLHARDLILYLSVICLRMIEAEDAEDAQQCITL